MFLRNFSGHSAGYKRNVSLECDLHVSVCVVGFHTFDRNWEKKEESQVVKSNSYYFQQSETVMQILLEFEKET